MHCGLHLEKDIRDHPSTTTVAQQNYTAAGAHSKQLRKCEHLTVYENEKFTTWQFVKAYSEKQGSASAYHR